MLKNELPKILENVLHNNIVETAFYFGAYTFLLKKNCDIANGKVTIL